VSNDSPDGMSKQELQQAGSGAGSDYAYLDQTRGPAIPLGGEGDGVGSPTLNPAYYPATVKPEALQGEAEKAGDEEFPTGGTPDAKQEKATAQTRTSAEDALKEQQSKAKPPQEPAKQESSK